MEIKADFDISPNSILEFVRVMTPELTNIQSMEFVHKIEGGKENKKITMKLAYDGKRVSHTYDWLPDIIDEELRSMAKVLVLIASGRELSWGSLMGVRPTKVVQRLADLGCTNSQIRGILRDFYLVRDDKISMLMDVQETQNYVEIDKRKINCYIGIPFCPTKCSYCSFASYEITSGVGRYYEGFVDTLLDEIADVGARLMSIGKVIDSIYIGGGTPSILTEDDLERVLVALNKHFDMGHVRELTFEAGREDTLNIQKLNIMKQNGVTRISLNPQCFNEKTLSRINRRFDPEHFDEIYGYARKLGFIINMDIIVGLPQETTGDILHTLDVLRKYDIENLTVHFLAFKRASNLVKKSYDRETLDKERILTSIRELVAYKQMKPYYLYRQKNIEEWGENTGYCRAGTESIFNITMIEENQETIGLGGGAITKIITKDENNRDVIERIVNPKDPALYIKEIKDRTNQKFSKWG